MPQQIEEHPDYVVVHLQGEIDMNTSPAARQQILKALQRRRDLLVDLSDVSYIDSSGVANLVEAYQLAKQRALYFGLVGVSSAAENVLRLARLDTVFPIHRSVAEWAKQARPSEA